MDGGKGKRGSAWYFCHQFKNKAKNRVDDLQGMFTDLQQARKENHMIDVNLLKEPIHQMLLEWKVELHEASPTSSLLAESLSSSELSSDMKRFLQLHEENDDAGSSSKIQFDKSVLRENNTAVYRANYLVDDLHTPEKCVERVSRYTDIGEGLHQNSYLQISEKLPSNIEDQEKKNYVQTPKHVPSSLVEGLEVTAGLEAGHIDFHQDYIPAAQPIFTLYGEEEMSPIF